MTSKAIADQGAQASLGDILNSSWISGLVGQLTGNGTVVIQNLHINWPFPTGKSAPGGLISYFGLEDWWQKTLNDAERGVIEDAIGDDVTKGIIGSTSRTAQSWLRSVAFRIGTVHPVLASKTRAKANAIESGQEIDDYWIKQLDAVRRYWLCLDFQAAREELIAVGYRIREENALPDVRAFYEELRKSFMRDDPYYKGVMDIVLPIVRSRPGVTQSVLAKAYPDIDIERWRYAMYYGEIIGDVKRVKSGRSYSLYAR